MIISVIPLKTGIQERASRVLRGTIRPHMRSLSALFSPARHEMAPGRRSLPEKTLDSLNSN